MKKKEDAGDGRARRAAEVDAEVSRRSDCVHADRRVRRPDRRPDRMFAGYIRREALEHPGAKVAMRSKAVVMMASRRMHAGSVVGGERDGKGD